MCECSVSIISRSEAFLKTILFLIGLDVSDRLVTWFLSSDKKPLTCVLRLNRQQKTLKPTKTHSKQIMKKAN